MPEHPVVTYSNHHSGGSFEESFDDNDFIDACFNSILLISNPHITKKNFVSIYKNNKPRYSQIVNFLKSQGLSIYLPNKIEIAEEMAVKCAPIPLTFVSLGKLINKIRKIKPVMVRL